MREFFGARSLVHSGLPPAHRLTGWLVEHGRRDDAALVMSYVAALGPGGRVPGSRRARTRIDVPGLDPRRRPRGPGAAGPEPER